MISIICSLRVAKSLLVAILPVIKRYYYLRNRDTSITTKNINVGSNIFFFVYLELIEIHKKNAKVLIYNCTYNDVKLRRLLLYFNFVLRFRTVLPLIYILIPDET